MADKDSMIAYQDVGPHGFIALERIGGNDLTIVNAARVSFDQQATWHRHSCATMVGDHSCTCDYAHGPQFLSKKDAGIVNFLMRERHGSPWEQVEVWFRGRAPIFVLREWWRHRIAEVNEESGRYSELKREFWTPSVDSVRKQVGKPGNYTYEPMDLTTSTAVTVMLDDAASYAFDTYYSLLELGVAKEVARTCLPLSTYSSFVWKSNLRALMNFLSLRNHEHAQREIREYASVMESMITPHLPYAMAAFVKHGRTAP
jgi:thymidylate synthase (FAD)